MTVAPVEEYVPWGHLKGWPQWMRTFFLGEAPVFHLLKEMERWQRLSDEKKEEAKQDNVVQIERREKTLDKNETRIKCCLTTLAFLFGGIVVVFSQHPQGWARFLAILSIGLVSVSVIILLRAILPPPHTLGTDFNHPFEWVEGEQGRKWTDDPDEQFVAKDHSYLLEMNHLVKFVKRSFVWATIIASMGLIAVVVAYIVGF